MKHHDKPHYQKYIESLEKFWLLTNEKRENIVSSLEEIAIKDDDALGQTVAYFYRGLFKSMEDNSQEESIEYAEKALEYAQACHNDFFAMKIYNLLGIAYSKTANYSDSLRNTLQAYYIATRNPAYEYEYVVLNNIGNLFVYLEEYETAATFIESAYEKYSKQQKKERLRLAQLIINIIDLYSCANNYEKVHHWTQLKIIDFSASEQRAIHCLQLMNEINMNKDVESSTWLASKMDEFLKIAPQIKTDIYALRCILKVFEVAIEKTDKETAEKFVRVINEWSNDSQRTLFELSIYDNLIAFETKFNEDCGIDEEMRNYYLVSRNTIRLMKNIYSTSLLLEIKLEEEKQIHRDFEEEKILLQKKVERDSFTNLYNKVHIEIEISNELKKMYINKKQAMFVMDIDYFKKVNDTLGHEKGDVILLEVADILREFLNENTLIGRYGGDEFVLFIKYYESESELENIAKRLCEQVRKIKLDIEDMPNVTLSIGIAKAHTELYFKQLFERADVALYECKQAGRNGYKIA